MENVVDRIKRLGYSVKTDSPFSGSIVPIRFYRRDPRVVSVMLEINRSLYLDGTVLKCDRLKLKRDVSEPVDEISSFADPATQA